MGFIALALMACADRAPTTAAPGDPAPSTITGDATAATPSGPAASATTTGSALAVDDGPEVAAPADPIPPIQLTTGGAVHGKLGVATSVDAEATKAAISILEQGGNAIDAAVALAYALAVTHSSAGNLGGGGFMVVRLANGDSFAIDFRETAPAAVTVEKVLKEVDAGAFGYASTAVPGTVAGLDLAREKLGSLPLAVVLAPAIRLAKKGHKISPRAAMSIKAQWGHLKSDAAARTIFGKANGKEPLASGDRLIQKDLAATLEAIARDGDAGFYAGKNADLFELAMKKNGGDVTKADLAAYHPVIRKTLSIRYRGFTVETMPPPSMGGVAVLETLRALELADTPIADKDTPAAYHLFLEAAKRAYRDRREVGADPDFYGDTVPPGTVERLLSYRYVKNHKPVIDSARSTPASELDPDAAKAWAAKKESPETTHFSVVDADGNAVSCTVTLSASFGAKVVVPGTGVVLSNALGAFSPSGPNAPAPGKRMASSMSPTIVSRDGKVVLVVGSPGGDTIPNTVTQLVQNLVDYQMPVDKAVARGRVHTQLVPDQVRLEKSREPVAAVKEGLTKLGHKLVSSFIPLGDAKVILVDVATGEAFAASDDREGGLAKAATSRKANPGKP